MSDELEAWMARNRLRRAKGALSDKIATATRRGFKSIMVPIELARSIIGALD